MMRAIFAREVLEEDVIRLFTGRRITVRETQNIGSCRFFYGEPDKPGDSVALEADTVIVLVHRPDPERDEDRLIDRIEKCAEEFVLKRNFSRQDEERTLTALRGAIEAYELAKPPAE